MYIFCGLNDGNVENARIFKGLWMVILWKV